MAEANNNPLVPARYIGHHAVNLTPGLGPYFNIDGTRRKSLVLETGDELLMRSREVIGFTLRYVGDQAFDLGIGRRVLPEHAGLDDRELMLAGYEFHLGRSDFEPINQAAQAQAAPQAALVPPTTIPTDNIVQPEPPSTNGG